MSSIRLDENVTAPATPATGKSIIYPKSDGLWYSKDDAGAETSLGGNVDLTADVTGTLPVANGGTGVATTTAYAVLCGGTTSTAALQSIAGVGTSGQVLTSNGAGALPTFQSVSGTGDVVGPASATDSNFAAFDTTTGKLIKDSTVSAASFATPSNSLKLDQTSAQTITTNSPIFGVLTASELVATDASKKLQSLAVATYPSLTEITYVKGVTSAIQTQLGAKQATITFGTGVETALGVNIGSAGAPVLFNGALGTPSSGTLTNATGLPISGLTASTSTAIGVGTVELGHASDTTVSRSAAGVIAVEGVVIPSISSTNTLTNKRITQRVVTTTDNATAVIDIDSTDVYELSAIANATTFTVTGTPTDGQKLIVRYKDAGASKGLTWTFLTAIGITLPSTTTISKWGYVGCIYNAAATAWHGVAVTTEA